MRYGVELWNAGPAADPRSTAELGHVAEDTGWDGFFISDLIVWDQQHPTYDPWVTLAAVAQRTARVRLGTMVTPLSRRRPWKVACEAVTVDHLSNGRLILGVGLGNCGEIEREPPDPSFTHFGEVTDARARAGMVDEALEILAGLWSGQPFSHAGRYFQVREITLLPPPVQRPRIPIWVGGWWPKRGPVRRAARWDGFFPNRSDLTPEDIRGMKTIIDERRTASAAFDIVVGKRRGVDWDQERARIRSLAEAGVTWWIEYIRPAEFEEMRRSIERGPLRIE